MLALKVFLRVLDRLDRREPAEFGRFPRCLEGELPEAQNLEGGATRKKKKHCPGRPVSRVLDEFPRFHHLANLVAGPSGRFAGGSQKSKFLTEIF